MSALPRIVDLGRRPYPDVLDAMRAFTAQRGADTPDELWLVEHDPVFTLGLAGRAEHVLAAGDIPVVKVERGGQVTYHGPGQAVVYVLLDLHRAGLTVRGLVNRLEQATIDLLAGLGVPAQRRDGMPGVYLAEDFAGAGHPLAHAKVASLGLKVSRGCTFHGIALNVAMDLAPFLRIDPCGYAGLTVTDVATARAALGDRRPVDVAAVARAFAAAVAESVIVART